MPNGPLSNPKKQSSQVLPCPELLPASSDWVPTRTSSLSKVKERLWVSGSCHSTPTSDPEEMIPSHTGETEITVVGRIYIYIYIYIYIQGQSLVGQGRWGVASGKKPDVKEVLLIV